MDPAERPYRRAHISEVPSLASDLVEAEWKPVRYHFGISGFGVNGYVARGEGELVVEEHADTQHEELYVVVAGTARFTVAGDTFSAPAGTLVFVPTNVDRAAWAAERGTAVLAFGAPPGALRVSEWERRRLPAGA
ncbi:MAG: cupin domain-containing protein [Actinomycetota bacterium]|nr:cupin domain-containing protein [Actinomycetota bacterium]